MGRIYGILLHFLTRDAQGAQGVKGLSLELAWPPQVICDCVYMWERTVMGVSVHTAERETEMHGDTPLLTAYYSSQYTCTGDGVGLQCSTALPIDCGMSWERCRVENRVQKA